jgi:hypothetical protein
MNRTRATIIAITATTIAIILGLALRSSNPNAQGGVGHATRSGHAPVVGDPERPLVAWPAESHANYQPTRKAGESCTVPRGASIQREAGPGWPQTVEQFTAQSEAVVVATAQSQRSWWHKAESSPDRVEAANSLYGVDPITATNYRVEQVIRGQAPTAIQIDQTGAPPHADYLCSAWGWETANDPLAILGQRYVLFLRRVLGDSRFGDWGAASRFPIVDGMVFSSLDLDPAAELSFRMPPAALEQFIQRIQAIHGGN